MRCRRLLTLLATTLCAALPLGASTASAKTIGIAEQKPEMFSDARFLGLGITHVRLNVQWNVLRFKSDTIALDNYMALAKAHGESVLVTIDRGRYAAARHTLPSVGEYRRQIAALHRRYPQVKEFSAWNEANHSGQPTYKHPERVAQYWLAIRRICPTCKVLAADLLDQSNSGSWAKALVKAARRLHAGAPGLWGLHNYIDANLHRTTGTRHVLKAVTGRVWITETAGLVSRKNSSAIKLPEGVTHAASTTSFILDRLLAVSPRIERAYLYMWNATAFTTTWDSAFIGVDNAERPSLGVLRRYLGKA